MKRRQRSDKEKFEAVLCGLREELSVSEICTRYEINQAQYYQWREKFLKEGSKIFIREKGASREEQLEKRISKMQQVIGELTLELKKND